MADVNKDLEQLDQALASTKNAIEYSGGLYTTSQMVKNVIYSLGLITVSGKANLDLLLGAILMLESVYRALEKKEAKANDNADQQGQNV